jgi:quercetin dioxygenase-like cupin family protein
MSGGQFSASLADMQAWADGIMASSPEDFEIGQSYIRRWWIVPRNDYLNLYLHEMTGPDDDRAMHDHPWANVSFILRGGYIEHTPDGVFERQEGDVIERAANALHRFELLPGITRTISLFSTGPKVREWGFACPNGWVYWRHFFVGEDIGQVGRGCGE